MEVVYTRGSVCTSEDIRTTLSLDSSVCAKNQIAPESRSGNQIKPEIEIIADGPRPKIPLLTLTESENSPNIRTEKSDAMAA